MEQIADRRSLQERALSLQEREMHRSPWLEAHGSGLNVAAHVGSIAANDLLNKGYRPRSSRDKALTAFAQLATLRLNVKRAMISLIDSTHQYVLAEATKTLSLADDTRFDKGDQLWLGSTVLAREDAVCSICFTETINVEDRDGHGKTVRAACIPDMREDPRFSTKPYVENKQVMFYAGVPILSRNGIAIGSYAVSNDAPRDMLTLEETDAMRDIALAIMDHLEWARDRVDRYKGEKIVRGLADFIDGSSAPRIKPSEEDTNKVIEGTTLPKDTSADESQHGSGLRPEKKYLRPGSRTQRRPGSRAGSPDNARSQPDSPNPAKSPPNANENKGDGLVRMLDRAATILRESTLADGVVFFGSMASHLTNSRSTMDTLQATGAPEISSPSSRTKSDIKSDSEDLTTKSQQGMDPYDVDTSDSDANSTKYCRIMGLSLAKEAEKESKLLRSSAFSVNSLEKYFEKFPHDEKWVAGGFIWTCTPGRMMNLDDDLSYLRAFGNAIMSEVARMNALKDDKAKTTFIASMSHELRSPLHGILGSVEFLQDTAADAYQSGLITSIATCGKTLLDTLDHVLDYAKINKLGRSKLRKQVKQRGLSSGSDNRDTSTESLNIIAEVDLGLLVEEVVEAVCAGHQFKKMHTGELSSLPSYSNTESALNAVASSNLAAGESRKHPSQKGAVAVLLDVSPRTSWMVRTQPGALRRIIMNLLGNSLKYTSSGFVAVSLRAEHASMQSSQSKIRAVIRVVDSGKGMSEDYQKNRLFVPFSQEDPFQPGTGLGLSIVKQIVESLGGSIELKSVQDVGTEIDVTLSLLAAENPVQEPERGIMDVTERTKGLKLCLLDPNREKQRPANDHIARLDTVLGEVCAGWFKMDIVQAQTMEKVDGDMFVYTEPPSVEYLLEHHGKAYKERKSGKEKPLIIVCMNAAEAITISGNHLKKLSELGRIVEVIPQPCGPRKLARVLQHCLRRVDEISDNPPERKPVSPPTSPKVASQRSVDPSSESDVTSPPVLTPSIRMRDPLSRESSLRKINDNRPGNMAPPSVAVSFPVPPPLNPDAPSKDLQAMEKGSPQEPRPGVPHLLLVDDNRINLQLLIMFMKKHKFTYREASNGQEALDTYIRECGPQQDDSATSRRRFDFVLMDISMPIMDGFEATRRIRAFEEEHSLKKTTVIALTGLASAQAQQEAEGSGVDIYLPKPVKFQELRQLLGDHKSS
ncbi:hypothetical protein H2203_001045 [Taxawa tesnikishii (nom. ined.)]|nr:hypothetical protein H2203_001045 [Dothideales sp. JES 119]